MHGFTDFNFWLLKIRNCEQTTEKNVNQAYLFWRSFWMKELSKITSNKPNWADEFYRHDYVGLITFKGQPVAIHLYGFQNLELAPCRGQSYFETYSPDFIIKVRNDGFHRVISTSWLAVNPEYQRLDPQILFSKCMLVLAQKVCLYFDFEANIATTRKDNGIADKILSWGAQSYGMIKHNDVPCEQLLITPNMNVPISVYEQEFLESIFKAYQRSEDIQKIAA